MEMVIRLGDNRPFILHDHHRISMYRFWACLLYVIHTSESQAQTLITFRCDWQRLNLSGGGKSKMDRVGWAQGKDFYTSWVIRMSDSLGRV